MNFGEKLKYLRDIHGLTQKDCAEQLNKFCRKNKQVIKFSTWQIQQWEVNRNLPGTERCIAISKYFNVSLDMLLRDDLNMNRNIN